MSSFPTEKATQLLPVEAGHLEIETTWSVGGGSLVAVICHPHPLFGGTMKNKVVTTIARAYEQLGIPTVRFNFRGVGKSDGQYGEGKAEQADLLSILDWLKEVLPQHQVCLAGFSFGSFVSAAVASSLPVQHLLSVAPPIHLYDYAHLDETTCPWLVVQGDQDEIVPFKQVQQWVKHKAIDFVVVSRAGHFFHGQLIELRELLVAKLGVIIK